MHILFLFSILLKPFLGTGKSIPSKLRSLTKFLSAFIILSGCIFGGFKCLLWHQTKHLLSLFLILIKPFIGFLILFGNLMYEPPDNGLKTEILTFSIYWFNWPTRSFINPTIYSMQNFLKRFIKHIFRINSCLSCRIKINRSKFYVSISFVFFNKIFTDIWYLKLLISSNKSLKNI